MAWSSKPRKVEVFFQRSCETCLFWDTTSQNADARDCRANPPASELGAVVWPITSRLMYCGRWKALPPTVEELARREEEARMRAIELESERASKTRDDIERFLLVHGYPGVSAKQIAQGVGVSEDTVMRHLRASSRVVSDNARPRRWRLFVPEPGTRMPLDKAPVGVDDYDAFND